jgi:hypothetical protein
MTEDAFSAWVSDRAAAVVALLNRRAREHRLDHCAATVEVALADGNRGSVGDVIITRRNDRRSASPPTMQLGQAEGVVDVLDVAEDTAGTDRGELLIISDQPYVRAQSDSKLDGGVQGQSVGHARFVMINKVDGPTAAAQSGSSPCWRDQMSLAKVRCGSRFAPRGQRPRQPTGPGRAPDRGVGVAVADDLEVEVVGVAAGEHRV